MATVKFTYALKRFFPELDTQEVQGNTVVEILNAVEAKYPGFSTYIVDEQGALRKHVNIYQNGTLIKDRKKLSDAVEAAEEIYFMQALSGG